MSLDYLSPVKDRLDGFTDYLESIEVFFQQEDSKLDEWIQTLKDKGNDPMETWGDFYWLTNKKNLMRMSLFLSLYAFLESILNEICIFEQIQRDIKLSVSELSHKGIERSKVYFNKVIEIDFPSNSHNWQKIKNYQKLRNHLTHKGLQLTEEDRNYSQLIRIIEQEQFLQMGEQGRISSQMPQAKLPELSQETIDFLASKFDKKYQINHFGFLGNWEDNFNYDHIRFKADFCREVLNTIDSFWRELIAEL